MKFSCADFTFPLLSHEKVFALLELLEFRGVDLGVFSGRSHLQPEQVEADVSGSIRRMLHLLEVHKLTPADVFLQTGSDPSVAAANDPDPEIRKRNRRIFQAVLEFACGIGAKHLTGLPGVRHSAEEPEADWALAVEEAAWRKNFAATKGVEYAVEAHVGSIAPDVRAALDFSRTSGVTHTLDYGHFVYQNQNQEEVHELLAYTSHFHARGGRPGGLQTSVAENQIRFSEILQRLKQASYRGWICLEYVWIEWEGCNRCDNLSETILLRELLAGVQT